jgi:hypothetical protein
MSYSSDDCPNGSANCCSNGSPLQSQMISFDLPSTLALPSEILFGQSLLNLFQTLPLFDQSSYLHPRHLSLHASGRNLVLHRKEEVRSKSF